MREIIQKSQRIIVIKQGLDLIKDDPLSNVVYM